MQSLRLAPLAIAAALLLACGEKFVGADEGGAGGMASAGKGSGGKGNGGSDAVAGRGGALTNGGFGGDLTAGGGPPLGGKPAVGGGGGIGGNPVVEVPAISQEGLELWFRADVGVAENNGVVTTWKDSSAHHRDALQTAVNFRPKLEAGTLNDLPGLVFDGVDDYLKLPALETDFGQGVSLFLMFRLESFQPSCDGYFEASNGPEVDDIHLGDWNESLNYEVLETWVNDTEHPLLVGGPQISAVIHQAGGLVQIRSNSNGVGEGQFATPPHVLREQVFIGRTLYDGCGSLHGTVGELLVYSRAVSDQELIDIEAYLQKKWQCCGL